jgi:UDP-glucuronate decarboxylase
VAEQKHILVTGGAGFIGKHLIQELVLQKNYVICLDDYSTSRPFENWQDSKYLEIMRHDVCEPFYLHADRIYHLACPASPVQYQKNPVRTIETAVLGTRNALRLARDTSARLLIASTSEVYGDPLMHPQPENYFGNVNPVGPRSCYDESKRCGEALAAAWARQYGTEVRIARLFNVYGAGMDLNDGRLLPSLVTAALQGKALPVFGDGQQTRSWCHVSDTVRGLISLMELEDAPSPLVCNIGNPDEHTVLEVAEQVLSVAKDLSGNLRIPKPVGIVHCELPENDPRVRRPDTTFAQELFGWKPDVPFYAGMEQTIRWLFRKGLVQ